MLLAFVMGQLSSSESSKNKRCAEIEQEAYKSFAGVSPVTLEQLLVESVALGCD